MCMAQPKKKKGTKELTWVVEDRTEVGWLMERSEARSSLGALGDNFGRRWDPAHKGLGGHGKEPGFE